MPSVASLPARHPWAHLGVGLSVYIVCLERSKVCALRSKVKLRPPSKSQEARPLNF